MLKSPLMTLLPWPFLSPLGNLTVPALPRLKYYFLNLILILILFYVVDLQCCVSFRYTVVSCTYVYPFFSMFFSHIGYYRILSRVPSPIHSVPVVYLSDIQQCVYVNPKLLEFIPRIMFPLW